MSIWLPSVLYKTFPLFCVLIGFFTVMVVHNPFAIVLAAGLYTYSFRVLWLRIPEEDTEKK